MWLYLMQFGEVVSDFFGETAYLVGSAAVAKDRQPFRDVDIRVMLDDARYEAEGYKHIGGAPLGSKWSSICLAFSALGAKMTDLPIDFQVQSMTDGNAESGPRHAIGIRPLPEDVLAKFHARSQGRPSGAARSAGAAALDVDVLAEAIAAVAVMADHRQGTHVHSDDADSIAVEYARLLDATPSPTQGTREDELDDFSDFAGGGE